MDVDIVMQNKLGQTRTISKIGFSWTVLFFCFFPPLFRSDFKWAGIIFGCALISRGLSNFVFMFIYNRLYINDLLQNGYRPVVNDDETILRANDFTWVDFSK